MVWKAMKNSLKKKLSEKTFLSKKSSIKNQIQTNKIFGKFSEIHTYSEGHVKNNVFVFRTHLIHQPFVSNATSCITQQ